MKFLATKNTQKKADNQPDFNIYFRDEQGNIIEEEYKKNDGTTGKGWKKFGAIWHKVEDGKIKSSLIDIDMKELLKVEPELKKMAQFYEDHLIKNKLPDYPTPTEVGVDIDEMNAIFSGEKPKVTAEDLDVNPDLIPF